MRSTGMTLRYVTKYTSILFQLAKYTGTDLHRADAVLIPITVTTILKKHLAIVETARKISKFTSRSFSG